MKHIWLALAFLFIMGVALASDFNNFDLNKVKVGTATIEILLDENSITVKAGSLEKTFNKESTGDYSFQTDMNFVLTGSDFFPEYYDPLYNAYLTCDQNVKAQQTAILQQIEAFSMGDLNALLSKFADSTDAMVGRKLADFDAKIDNTFIPARAEFDTLKSENDRLEKDFADVNKNYFVQKEKTDFCNNEALPTQKDFNGILQVIILVLVVIVIVLIAAQLGAFERFQEKWGLE